METLLLTFARRLRQAGLPVTLAELIDAGKALACLDVTDREAIWVALRCTMCKNVWDHALFDKIFELTFRAPEAPEPMAQTEAGMLFPALGVNGYGVAVEAGSCRSWLDYALRNPIKIKALAAGMASFLPLAGETVDVDSLLHQAKVWLGWFMVEAALGHDRGKRRLLSMLEQELRRRLEERLFIERGPSAVAGKLMPGRLDFTLLSDAQQQAVLHEIGRLADRFRFAPGRRFRPAARQGRIDLRRTCRVLLQRGRLQGSLRYKKKKPRRVKLLVLCDWSGSVRPYALFLLRLVYALYTRFPSTAVFLFIDRVAEITPYLKKYGFGEGLTHALEQVVISRTNNSDYGAVFYQFWRDHLQQVSPQTCLLVIGDAKNLFKADEREFFAVIARKAERIYWLNPEPREKWNTHDSIIGIYAPYCNAVMECRNLEQLSVAVAALR